MLFRSGWAMPPIFSFSERRKRENPPEGLLAASQLTVADRAQSTAQPSAAKPTQKRSVNGFLKFLLIILTFIEKKAIITRMNLMILSVFINMHIVL